MSRLDRYPISIQEGGNLLVTPLCALCAYLGGVATYSLLQARGNYCAGRQGGGGTCSVNLLVNHIRADVGPTSPAYKRQQPTCDALICSLYEIGYTFV
ncbi:hypothetical protein EVAR_33483_1 [Eumeta japonica]|uniref:Uncharacterized protein n=1 Tax=Eumeta variegata TaxID=151549 RepID=A0A4C1WH89_EUMVA|nr:hypothetical protein EVAR_33483_1 [Eumeta japonica]